MTEIAPHIVIDEKICRGKLVIQGTRVLVEVVLGNLASGMTPDEVAAEYEITRDEVLATIHYAAATIAGEELRAVGT